MRGTDLTTFTRVAIAAVLLSALGTGLYGMGRSLWLDEAWVANSVNSPSVPDMFFHTGWLQVNPPLFLLLTRACIRIFGLSNMSLRLVPLSLGILAVLTMLVLARRSLSPAFAVLATALLALHPTAIEYSHSLKQYSGELAATTVLLLATILYLRQPGRTQFIGVLAAAVAALLLSYPTIFLMPGVVLAIAATKTARAALVAAVAGGVFLGEYLFFIRPNFSPALREFFKTVADSGFSLGLFAALVFCIAVAGHLLIKMRRTKPGWREWTQIVCLLPCLLLALSGALGLYPNSHRTRLFVLPCFMLLVTMSAEELFQHFKIRLDAAVLCVAIAIPFGAIWKQVSEHRNEPSEDIAGSVRFLQKHVGAEDVVLVHPSVREGFLLYAAMYNWAARPAVFTDTGWPCCQRDKDPKPGGSTEAAIFEDLDARIPHGFSGRVWLYYTTRPTHWTYVGMKEQDTWKKYLWGKGCVAGPYFAFANQAISPMDCPDVGAGRYTVGGVPHPWPVN